jgi:hypothetical protein
MEQQSVSTEGFNNRVDEDTENIGQATFVHEGTSKQHRRYRLVVQGEELRQGKDVAIDGTVDNR